MRITHETLLGIANDTVKKRARQDVTILAAYLCGAALQDQFLLGGTLDIDIVFIHIGPTQPEREIVRMTREVHIDIAHHGLGEYDQPRLLRSHPWLGPTVFDCKPLYDRTHQLDFIQASVRGLFSRPDTILERARPLAEKARQAWFSLQDRTRRNWVKDPAQYLKAVEQAANAIALLSGGPLTERRFLSMFAGRAAAVKKPGLYAGLLGLLGGAQADQEMISALLEPWQAGYSSLSKPCPAPRLHQDRMDYYLRGMHALLEGADPRQALWPLLNTWNRMALVSPQEPVIQDGWRAAAQKLGLAGDGFKERVSALDAYLDQVEETLDEWAERSGAA